jgi:hypothetical protein
MNEKKIAILQSNYIPWKGYFDLIDSVDVFVIYDEVQYTKNDWRNRNIIKTRHGKEWITIPARQRSLDQRIDETQVSLKNWNVKHWNTIVTNYSRAGAFKEVREFLENLYLATPFSTNLSEINKIFLVAISNFLGITTEIISSDVLQLRGDRNERLVEACLKLKANVYLSGPAASEYLQVDLFHHHGIQVEWMNYSGYPQYPQLFPPFIHGVSILDVILNTGPSAKAYIKKTSV